MTYDGDAIAHAIRDLTNENVEIKQVLSMIEEHLANIALLYLEQSNNNGRESNER